MIGLLALTAVLLVVMYGLACLLVSPQLALESVLFAGLVVGVEFVFLGLCIRFWWSKR